MGSLIDGWRRLPRRQQIGWVVIVGGSALLSLFGVYDWLLDRLGDLF